MFKKPLGDLKTPAPLRSSDRRKLRQRVIELFSLQPEVGDLLVPDGLRSAKFSTNLNEHGVVYTSLEGDPLWFTVGKGSDELIPTVYALWKHRSLLPVFTTPARVIPVLVGGADLMIPGVVQHPSSLTPDTLVAIAQYHPNAAGPPLAVGRSAVDVEALKDEEAKGKAVIVLHMWTDKLWEMGKGKDAPVPEPLPAQELVSEKEVNEPQDGVEEDGDAEKALEVGHAAENGSDAPTAEPITDTDQATLTPEEVTAILRTSLLQSISATLSALPASCYPLPASTFYTQHLLPARPAYPVYATPVDIKHSSWKNLAALLKAAEKEGLVSLKQAKGDVLLSSVNGKHPDILGHHTYRTVGQEAERQQKREARERDAEARQRAQARVINVTEFWKPHQTTVRFFEDMGKDPEAFYTQTEVLELFREHITTHALVNPHDQAYLVVGSDGASNTLHTAIGAPKEPFMKRDAVFKKLLGKMQAWHTLKIEGKDAVSKKGEVKPILVSQKMRVGRKMCTLVTGFEPFGFDADEMAEELRKMCAGSTAITPLQGKNAGLEVMVQGRHKKTVREWLVGKGVPSKWVVGLDDPESKKK